MVLSAYLTSIEIEQCPGENGQKPQTTSLLCQQTRDLSLPAGAFINKLSYLYTQKEKKRFQLKLNYLELPTQPTQVDK
jgi:hypothetical protein